MVLLTKKFSDPPAPTADAVTATTFAIAIIMIAKVKHGVEMVIGAATSVVEAVFDATPTADAVTATTFAIAIIMIAKVKHGVEMVIDSAPKAASGKAF